MQRLAWNDRLLASVLLPGCRLQLMGGDGALVDVLVEAVDGQLVRARADGPPPGPGTLATARVAEGDGVAFLQLVVDEGAGAGLVLRVLDGLRVPNERCLERSGYGGPAALVLGRRILPARVLDVSPVGFRLAVEHDVPVGELVRLRLGDESEALELRARVLRSTGEQLAAEIVDLTQAGWVALERLLEPRSDG